MRNKKRRKKKNKPQDENIMVCPIPQGDRNNTDLTETLENINDTKYIAIPNQT